MPTRIDIAARYRRARVYFAIAVLLLAGTALYECTATGKKVWDTGHRNAEILAVALQSRITSELEQSTASLMGIASDLEGDAPPARMRIITVLQDAMRFDPISAYLCAQTSDGVTAIDHTGQPVPRALEDTLLRVALRAPPGQLALKPLIRLSAKDTWYLPVILAPGRGSPLEAIFALVPARRLLAGAESLELIPDSWISLVNPDGTRLLRYSQGRDGLEVGGARVPREVLELVAKNPSGTLDRTQLSSRSLAQLLPGSAVAGYSRSPSLPLYVSAVIPLSSLLSQWVREAAPQGIVLLMGLAATILFAQQLNTALRRQGADHIKQEYLATHDSLTGLFNRDAFMRLLVRSIETHPEEPFAVVLLDLNRFKDINDTLGHAHGDRVLEEVGKRLKALWREDEACVARLGGDELAVFTRHAHTPEALEALFAGVQRCLGEPILTGGVELELSASMGAALYPQDAGSAVELLRCSDIAMYAAKTEMRPSGRYSKLVDHFTPETLALRAELAKALRENKLWVAYQPKRRLSDGALVGLEALSRWNHPALGPVHPSYFVALAESTELIHPFTQWMLQAVARQLACWRAAGHCLPVSVNISSNNLLDHTFVENLSARLENAAIPPQLLELEITESAVMRHPETTIKRLKAIRDLGVQLAIDDFGTGYAALSYLKQLPVQTLKIDKSFILNLMTDEADQRIVRSSIQLAHSFDMGVVAEGVESAAVAQQLRDYGCDCAQGFYFGMACAAGEISWT
jgi:diguanylate cyclase (GGDEF)-like protein